MSGTPDDLSVQSLRDFVRDLEKQRRLGGLVLTGALVGMVKSFRWLNTGPYAGNYVYFALMLASLLADRDARHATRNPA